MAETEQSSDGQFLHAVGQSPRAIQNDDTDISKYSTSQEELDIGNLPTAGVNHDENAHLGFVSVSGNPSSLPNPDILRSTIGTRDFSTAPGRSGLDRASLVGEDGSSSTAFRISHSLTRLPKRADIKLIAEESQTGTADLDQQYRDFFHPSKPYKMAELGNSREESEPGPSSATLQETSSRSSLRRRVRLQHYLDVNNDDAEFGDSEDDKSFCESLEAEEKIYEIKQWGTEEVLPNPVAEGTPPWRALKPVKRTFLQGWALNVGDIASVCCYKEDASLAKVSQIRVLDDDRFLLLLVWFYTREGIEKELREVGRMSRSYVREYLNTHWPANAPYKYILSSYRTVTMWDTLLGPAASEITKICRDKLYITGGDEQKICKASDPKFRWMKNLLDL